MKSRTRNVLLVLAGFVILGSAVALIAWEVRLWLRVLEPGELGAGIDDHGEDSFLSGEVVSDLCEYFQRVRNQIQIRNQRIIRLGSIAAYSFSESAKG